MTGSRADRDGWWRRHLLNVLGLVVLLLTGATAWQDIDQGAQTRHIAEETRRLVVEFACPLLGLFLKSYHPELQPPTNLDFYERAFADIRRMNTVLNCPPR